MARIFSIVFAAGIASASAPAHAALNRAWVSGHGVDGPGCGPLTSPCRQISYVLANNIIVPGGEVDILDPSGFAPVTITYAVSIVNDGVGTASIAQGTAGQNSITISAGASDSVHLRGLSLEGLGTGQHGVFLRTAASVTIINCVARHFANSGMWFQPNVAVSPFVKISLSNVVAADNGNYGVIFYPHTGVTIRGIVNQTTVSNNGNAGIMVSDNLGGASTVTVSQSTAFANGWGAISGYGGIVSYGVRSGIWLNASVGDGNYPYDVAAMLSGSMTSRGNNSFDVTYGLGPYHTN